VSHRRMLALVERATGRHWSWALAVTIGIAFAGWLTTELVLLGGPGAAETAADRVTAYLTYAVLGTAALALLLVPHTRGARSQFSR
jgi:hypothetical protein